jgi:myo-inositol-1(or 4)-monophosphatase
MTTELQLARTAALAAGELLKAEFLRGSTVHSDLGKDIKLEADVLAERLILGQLRAGSALPILSEEAGPDTHFATAGRRWVVDPLDGTFNFSRHLPLCCVSIGLCDGDRPVLGVIHDFMAGVTYEGVVGLGAWRNGQPMRVSAVVSPTKAALCTGFPVGREFGRDSLLGFVRQAQTYKKVRLLGSAALSLAHVAAGVVEVYHEDDINFWDVAAGLALVSAAGGRFDCRPGSSQWQREVFASNGHFARPAGES